MSQPNAAAMTTPPASSLNDMNSVPLPVTPALPVFYGGDGEITQDDSKSVTTPELSLINVLDFSQIGQPVNEAFKTMATFAQRILWKGQSTRVETIPAKALFPNTNYYVTYEGSLTQPGCYETVTWVIFNKPIYISKDMLTSLRRLQQGIKDDPNNIVANNNRPIMPINNRVVRTNINHPGTSTSNICGMTRYTFYQSQSTRVETIPAKALFPNTNYYVTYEGSLTQPGCYETVTWVIFNKPIYISTDMLTSLRRLQQGIKDDPNNIVANNNRPIMPINNRVVRTNINHPGTSTSNICGMTRYTFYQINPSLDV